MGGIIASHLRNLLAGPAYILVNKREERLNRDVC
jgi:hypothetical protein